MSFADRDIDSATLQTRFSALKVGANKTGVGDYTPSDKGPYDGIFQFQDPQTLDMNDAQVALTHKRAASATQITSNVLYVDPNSAGGTEDLLLPPEADCDGDILVIVNTAGGAEDIVVKEDGDSTTICTLNQNEMGICVCDGTTWRGFTGPSATEEGYLSGITPGTVTASKAVVVDGSKDIADFGVVGVGTLTGATLIVESLNPMTFKLNDTNALQVDNAAITSFAAAADTVGTPVYVETQDGGADTAADGAIAGGLLNIKTGDAGAAGADQVGAAGGAFTVESGAGTAGGAHTSNNPAGGAGGKLTISGGTGGASGSSGSGNAGAGGEIEINSGTGGALGTSGTGTAGAGGLIDVNAGTAGAAVADQAGGIGGAINLDSGAGTDGGAHTANNPAGGAGGAIDITGGVGGIGGSSGSGAGGAGGAITITTGVGGASGASGTGTSGAGGTASFIAGAAGTAAADTPGGAGGAVAITAGAASAGGTHSANNPSGGDGGDITLTVGAAGASGGGSGVAGSTGEVKVSAGCLSFANAQTIAMGDTQVVLTRNPGTPTGTEIVSNVLYVDPDSAGGTEDLLLPPEADCNGLALFIINTAGGAEDIVVKEDGDSTTICTISQSQVGWVACDGTTWRGGIMAET